MVRNNDATFILFVALFSQFIAPVCFVFWHCIYMTFLIVFMFFLDQGGLGSDRMSDDSSKEAVSDSHPDTLTDPEFSDPPNVTSSPPHSGDEVRRDKDKVRFYFHEFFSIYLNIHFRFRHNQTKIPSNHTKFHEFCEFE